MRGSQIVFILDYAGIGYDIYTPEIGRKNRVMNRDCLVSCPACNSKINFGEEQLKKVILLSIGRKCRGVRLISKLKRSQSVVSFSI